MNQTPRIAIVGLAARFPGSGADLGRFWQNVRTGADCSCEVPAGRWLLPPERCFDPRVANPDTVYSTRGYFLDPFEPDVEGLGLPPELIAELDPLFHLILDVGHRAWKSANTANVDRRKVGVILGNICLPTDKASDLARSFLAPPAPKVHPWNRYVAGLPAGMLAKALGLAAGHFTLDAACASSLYAIKLACDELVSGRADAMLAGGASRPDCLYTQMGFSQLRALSVSGKCSPFSSNADGLVVGEGSGIFVLKRLEDAERDGDTIRAVIRGWGVSNDIHGNLLAPSSDGQLRAMCDAYAMAGWQPSDVGMIECHATGTPVGDRVEFESLRELWKSQSWQPGQCVIGSVKSTVGHLLTGASSAALAKTIFAIENKTLPPQANFVAPNGQLDYADGPFRLLKEAEEWHSTGPRRAAISGFGFGGVNAHVLIEEYEPAYADVHAPIVVSGFDPKADLTPQPPLRSGEGEPIAIIGIGTHVGPWKTAEELKSQLLTNAPTPLPVRKRNGWDHAPNPSPAGYFIESIAAPLNRFRIPPREMEEMLPQQLLMLHVAAEAMDDSGPQSEESKTRTGVFIGLGLDLNTTNFHLRWATGDPELPALSADRTIGALGSIAASRIARAFHFGGPSFTCCSEETSSGTAIALAVRALRRGELDRALVGGVDLTGDPRQLLATAAPKLPAEGAAAVVLKRLADAERDGDRVYAVIRGVGTATGGDPLILSTDAATYASSFVRACTDAMIDPATIDLLDSATTGGDANDSPEAEALSAVLSTTERRFPLALAASREQVGHTGAASALVSIVQLSLALHHQILPATQASESITPSDALYSSRVPRYWLADRDAPRRAALAAIGADGSCVHVVLEEASSKAEAESPTLHEGLFALDAGNAIELQHKLTALAEWLKTQGEPSIGKLAGDWWRANPLHANRKLGAALVARTRIELFEQIDYLSECIADPTARDSGRELRASLRDRVFYSPVPLGPKGKIAFVFPGSGNHFPGMGRDLSDAFPEVLRKQQTENLHLRGQYAPDKFWADFLPGDTTAKQYLFGQVALGTLVSDTLVSLGIMPVATIGLSLGESSSLFGLRVWTDRDEMFRRVNTSTLFGSDLGPPYDAARQHWKLDEVNWVSGVISASPDDVRSQLRHSLKAFLLIVNTPTECVIGGLRSDVEQLANALGKSFFALSGVTLAHCEAGKPVEEAYRQLHTLPTTEIPGLQIFSGAWARPYDATSANAADSITAGLLNTLDFPVLLDAAYREGVRVFIEVGPGNSCTRMIATALNGRAHLARAITVARQDAPSNVLRLIGALIAERYPVDLSKLFGPDRVKRAPDKRTITIPVGRRSHDIDVNRTPPVQALPSELVTTPKPVPTPPPLKKRPPIPFESPASLVQTPAPNWESTPPPRQPVEAVAITGWAEAIAPVLASTSAAQSAVAEAHELFLRVQQGLTQTTIATLQLQNDLIRRLLGDGEIEAIPISFDPQVVPRSLTFEQCTEYAVGKIGRVLGALFAEADNYPTRVRLPEGPLMLVDRVLKIEGEPKSMTRGRVVTDHTVRADRWYLDNGRCPTSITVEAGQADLFLSGFLGIDFTTKGLAVYRLLDAVVTFHRELPRVGERIEYDIHIDEFFRQADSWLFRFRFEGTIDGEPLLSMTNGVAGFFTAKALAAGQGIIHTKLDRQPMAGKKPTDWKELVPFETCSLSAERVKSLHRGDLAGAFGSQFTKLPLKMPMKLPAGMLRLVDRVPLLDPTGGRFGLGFVRAEYDIQPKEWFIECHFIDDKVMPGTLMYECCLHTLRTLLMRMGWLGEEGSVTCEPVPGVMSRLKCRGQVLDTTKLVTYEVSVKELGFRPEPYCIADALMYADGKPIVEITNLSLRMSGLNREMLQRIWASPNHDTKPAYLYGPEKIMAYSNGKPSEGFGEPYRIFDEGRVIARLPGPPYQFLDGITAVTGEPFVLKDGASCKALYAVPADAWYFAANRADRMPFSILLEIALQPCGWLAAFCGSALTSDSDLSFRNLGGQGTQFELVGSEIGTLTTRVTMTKVSNSAGMIIQHFDLLVLAGERKIYEGTTYFGFFAKTALQNQVGMPQAKVPYLSEAQTVLGEVLPHEAPFPEPMLRMVDRIDGYLPQGGSKGLGLVQGRIAVDPGFWFFKAHFYQDPVWPGSLGVESFLQLLKYVAWKRWGAPPAHGWQTVAPNRKHAWTYRGQVLPTDREVIVVLEITAVDESAKRLTADGFLTVDGRVIYQMTNFTLE